MFLNRAKIYLVVTFVFCITSLILLHFNGFSSNDFWIQATIGKLILTNWQIPRSGLLAFTPAQNYPYIAHEWLSSVFMALIAVVSETSGFWFAIVKCAIAFTSACVLFKLSYSRSKNTLISVWVVLLVSWVISFRLSLRAENWVFIVLPVFWYVLEKFKDNIKLGAVSIFLLIVWTNLHGSYLVGLILVLFYSVYGLYVKDFDSAKKYAILFAVQFLASFINPFGYRLIIHSWHNSISEFMSHYIQEWQPTFSADFMQTPSFYVYIIFVGLSCLLVLLNIKKIKLNDTVLYFVFLGLSLYALRHIAYFAIFSVPALSSAVVLSSSRIKLGFYTVSIALLLCGIAFVLKYSNFIQNKPGTRFEAPLAADTIEYLKKIKIHGNVFNSYMLGDQLAYNFYPDVLITIDARTDFYGEDYIRRYVNTMTNDVLFLNFLKEFNVHYIILQGSDLNEFFIKRPERLKSLEKEHWKVLFRSEDNIVLGK